MKKMENQKQLVLNLIDELKTEIEKNERLLDFISKFPSDEHGEYHTFYDIEITARHNINELKEKLSYFDEVLKLYND